MFRLATALCLIVTFAVVANADDAANVARRPNIVLIVADDLGYGHLGCYGQTRIRTPHLDKLAADGTRFTQFYAGCAVCAPSRCVLMTGRHGGHTPVRGNSGGIALPDGEVTIAETLKRANYATGLFGKWGLGEHGTEGTPNRQGFDEFFGYLHQIHAHFHYPEYLWQNDEKFPLPGNTGTGGTQYTHDVIVERALDFVRWHGDEPFLLYVPLLVPHYELLVPENSLAEYRGQFPETPYTGRGRAAGYPSDYAAQPHPRAATAAMITRMDASVGQLMALLDELDLEENTLVLFTSDNGPSAGASDPDFFRASGGLRGYKATLYEGGIRVPLIARWPGHIPRGSVNDATGSFADFLPTFAELAGVDSPKDIDGASLVSTLHGETEVDLSKSSPRTLYWELSEGAIRAARVGEWKGIRTAADAPLELYDLKADPGETIDVAGKQPEVAAKLSRILDTEHVDAPPQIEPDPPAGREFQ